MRVCVIGAGAIGGLLAVRLSLAGNEVSVLARGETLAALGRDGLRLIEPDGSELTATDLQVSDQMSQLGPHELVVLTVKAHQLASVAAELPALYGPRTAVVPLQNGIPWWFFQRFGGALEGHRIEGLDPDGELERSIPSERILGAIAYPAVQREAAGVVRLVEGDRFPFGELDGTRSSRAVEVAETFTKAGFKSRVVTDLRSHLWVKAWGNLAFNPISALTGATLREICNFPPTRSLAEQAMLEASAVAERLGLRLRLSVEQRIDGAAKVGDHKTSMLQDVESGRSLEVEALVGSFVELGRLTGTPTPTIANLYSMVSLLSERISRSPEA